MNVFSKFKNELNKSVNTVSIKSKDMIEITKINNQIGSFQDQKRDKLSDLGAFAYYMFCNDGICIDELNQKCTEIKEIDNIVKTKNEQIEAIKNEQQELISKVAGQTCECGEIMAQGAMFCRKCGKKLQTDVAIKEESNMTKCTCGANIKLSAKFCTRCGKPNEKYQLQQE